MSRRSSRVLALLALVAGAACQPTAEPEPLPAARTPIPERQAHAGALAAEPESPPLPLPVASPGDLKPLLSAPGPVRFATPGAVRWARELEHPVSFVEWSPLGGLSVSAGPQVHNVTSQGVDRWTFVAGEDHRLFTIDEQLVVWSPRFGRISQIIPWGRQGWERKWSGDLVDDGSTGFYLIDAATVATIGPDGQDRWRAALDNLRRLEGPYPCADGSVFHGIRGLEGIAVTISGRGAVMHETRLDRGAVVLGASESCEPLIWRGGEVSLLDSRGLPRWRHPIEGTPLVRRLPAGFLLASAGADRPVHLDAVSVAGERMWSRDLPVSGRLTGLKVAAGVDAEVPAIGLCLDVSSPCARPKGTRGPFNALVTADRGGGYRTLLRQIQGHLDFTPHPQGGLVIASTADGEVTELTHRDLADTLIWQVSLPGRLSAGPYIGPAGEIYLATCRGWDCGAPYQLFAVTGAASEPTAGT